MPKITLLSPLEAQKIAAGEVVERPVSIVKECVENALDAGAKSISLYVEKVGTKLLRFVDDGCGMSADDLRLCIQPFATSKIRTLDDLEALDTFGFRGEALASISAVSRLEIKSKERHLDAETLGTAIEVIDGQVTNTAACAVSGGTDLAIHDLFYNTPVRKKFLRSDETEWHAIQQVIFAFCLSHLDVHFTVFRDQQIFLQAPPVTTLVDRVCQVWDLHLAQQMIPVSFTSERGDITVTGVISNAHVQRYNKQNMMLFVNSRWVKNQDLTKAVMRGYGQALPPGKFPVVVLSLTIDGTTVDVNIHPRKEEVRFVKPGLVENAIQSAVKQALEQQITRTLNATPKPTQPVIQRFAAATVEQHTPLQPRPELKPFAPFKPLTTFLSHETLVQVPQPEPEMPVFFEPEQYAQSEQLFQQQVQEPVFAEADITPNPRLIGQLDKTYVLLEGNNELIVIDQHAAHERILYERWMHKFEKKEGTRLMFPLTVQLPAEQLTLIIREKDFFAAQGIELERFSPTSIVIHTTPPHIQGVDITECIRELAAVISTEKRISPEELRTKLNEHMHSHLACKAAVKAGDELSVTAQQELIKDLFAAPNRHMCIHGRPTMWTISIAQLAKNFRRPTG